MRGTGSLTAGIGLLLCLMLSAAAHAQVKLEREYRIKAREVPEPARAFTAALPLKGKLRWYAETGLDSQTYEAKARLNGSRISIEFSRDGELEDAEVERSLSELPQPVLDKVETYLRDAYERFSIKKVQFQYSGDPAAVLGFLRDGSGSVELRYELVASVREQERYALMEWLFSQAGELLEKKEILHRSSDNLAY